MLCLFLVLLISVFIPAEIPSYVISGEDNLNYLTNSEGTQSIELLVQLQHLNKKMANMPTIEEINTNFSQLDYTVRNKVADSSNTQLALIDGINLINDLLIISFFGIISAMG